LLSQSTTQIVNPIRLSQDKVFDGLSSSDKISKDIKFILNYLRANRGYNKWLGNDSDHELFESVKVKLEDVPKADEDKNQEDIEAIKVEAKSAALKELELFRNDFTQDFYQFVVPYINTTETNIYDVTKESLLKLVEDGLDLYEESFKIECCELYEYLKAKTNYHPLMYLNAEDFEFPSLFLRDLIEEQKSYLIRIDDFIRAKVNSNEEGNIEGFKSQFIVEKGKSPVDLINEVLDEYKCNGYKLQTEGFQFLLRTPPEQLNIKIYLNHTLKHYHTQFDKLSSGEQTLIALTLMIYKCGKDSLMPRVLLLDEVDASLHPKMVERLLKVINNKFIMEKNLKVIMATHSPTTVAKAPENCSIYEVDKDADQIAVKTDKRTAIHFLTDGFAVLTQEDSDLGIEYNISKTNKHILFTEGITDKIIVTTAWNKLNPRVDMPFYIQNCYGAGFLNILLSNGDDAQDGIFTNYPEKKFIGLFDFDGVGYCKWNGVKKFNVNVNEDPLTCLTRKHLP